MPDTREMRKIMELLNLAGMGEKFDRLLSNQNKWSKKMKLTRLVDDDTDHLSVRDIQKADFAGNFANYLLARGVTVQVEARWEELQDDGQGRCSNCHVMDDINPLATHCRFCGAKLVYPRTDKP